MAENWGAVESDAEAEDEEENSEFNKDAILFLVDCHPSMFEKTMLLGAETSAFAYLLGHLVGMLKKKIVSRNHDLASICFFSTKKKKNLKGEKGYYSFAELEEPKAQTLRELARFASDQNNFLNEIGADERPDAVNFDDVLNHAKITFSTNKATEKCLKKVFIFTNQSDPSHGNLQCKKRCISNSEDLEKNGVDIQLFPLDPPNAKFEAGAFYNSVILVDNDEDQSREILSGYETLEAMGAELQRKIFSKRTVVSGEFTVTNDSKLAFKMYTTISRAVLPSPEQLEAKTNQPLTCETSYICKETGSILEDHQIKTFYRYANERIFITKEEVAAMKGNGRPGLLLMGFKDRRLLLPYHNVRTPHFIYPDESKIKGSTLVFRTLLEEMENQNVFAVARFTFRSTSVVRYVALIPQMEVSSSYGNTNYLTSYPGFNMIYLPFANEIRDVKMVSAPKVPESLVEKAKKITCMKMDTYVPRDLPNPKLQKFYRVLENVALDQTVDMESLDAEVDLVFPDPNAVSKLSKLCQDFNSELETLSGPVASSVAKPAKRKAADVDGDDAPKASKAAKVKNEDDDDVFGVEEARALFKNDMLKKATVAQLKSVCSSLKLIPKGGKALKGDLIGYVQAYFEAN